MSDITIDEKLKAISVINNFRNTNKVLDDHIFTDKLRDDLFNYLEEYYESRGQDIKEYDFDAYFKSCINDRFAFTPYKLSTFQKIFISIYHIFA